MTSALQRLRAANADPIGPATSVSAQASRARHWPSLIALGRRAECKFILHLWKAMTKLTSYQLESNTDPSFPFVDPLPKRYMCCISAGLTWRLRQRSAIWRSTCSSELLTLLQARMRFSILRTESKGLRFPKHSSIRNVISWKSWANGKQAWEHPHRPAKQSRTNATGLSVYLVIDWKEHNVKKRCKSLQHRLRHV